MTAPDEEYGRRDRILSSSSQQQQQPQPQQQQQQQQQHTPSNSGPPTPQPQTTPQFPPGERFGTTSERFPISSERFSTLPGHGSERFIPPTATPPERCIQPDRFTQSNTPTDRYTPGTSTPERYHTPTPNQDRYIAGTTTDRYQTQSTQDRYIAPPAPTPERYTPENRLERYTPANGAGFTAERYQNGERYPPGERYIPPPAPSDRYVPSQNGVVERFTKSPVPSERYQNGYLQDRYTNSYLQSPTDRYPPPPAPNERYVPNQNSDRYTTNFLPPSPNYIPNGFIQPATNPGDPYMRRDLGYHHHYRLQHPYHNYHHYHRALPPAPHHRYHQHIIPSPNHRNHLRCCPSPNHLTTNSTSSQTQPSSAPVTVSGTPISGSREYLNSSPSMSRGRTTPQRNSVDFNFSTATTQRTEFPRVVSTPVEYVGASGGRHVSTPPPPPSMLPRCASMSNCDVGIENPMCDHAAHRRGCVENGSTMSLCCASARRYGGQVNVEKVNGIDGGTTTTVTHGTLQHTPHHTSVWRAVGQPQVTPQSSPQASPPGSTPVVGTSPTATPSSPPLDSCPSTATPSTASPSTSHHGSGLERSISAPDPTPTPTSDVATPRPQLQRSMSRSEVVRNFIRRETAVFFGIEEDCEKKEQAIWLERRKRLACRKYGQLREEYQQAPSQSGYASSPTQRSQQLTSAYTTQQQPRDSRPDVLPVGRDSTDLGRDQMTTSPRWTEPPVRRKESVARMTFGGLAYVVTTLTRQRQRPAPPSRQYSRSYPLAVIPEASALVGQQYSTDGVEESFFDRGETVHSVSTPAAPVAFAAPLMSSATVQGPTGDTLDAAVDIDETVDAQSGGFTSSREQLEEPSIREKYVTREGARRTAGWRRPQDRPETIPESGPEVGCSRIWSRVLDRAFDNSDRRQYGMGFVGRFFGRTMKKSVTNQETVKEQLEDIEDYRPFFTYWITTVQILILFISLFCYGLGPVGIDLNNRSGEVLVTSLSLQQVEYQEPANFWIGPRAGDLIHLGAKFAPCMRKDAKIIKEIEKGREKERETACCIRNDDSGCVQSSQADCSVRGLGGPTKTISTWKKWSNGDSGPGGRMSGSVCGLDPKHCESPASVAPHEWPDDITKWPICRKSKNQNFRPRDKVAEHMVCEVIGHPCCIGIHGMCRITTKEYCDFVRGYFHDEASLCSQVSCLDDVCGMIPFYSPEVPDQFYRLWTSLFLHAGIGHLVITLAIQYLLMRDLEKLTGPLRIGIIYMGSGIAGNLASAIFVPYRAEVGPAGAQFGLLACLIVEVLNVWPMLKHPDHALLKLLSITLVLFLFGLLPWVDNYAHLFGFIFGFLLSYALMPFVSFGPYDRHKKYALIWVCLLSALFLFCALVVLFYVIPVYDCEVCNYFTCLPLTRDFCASQNINFRREEPVV